MTVRRDRSAQAGGCGSTSTPPGRWTRADRRHALFPGAQAEFALASDLSLMMKGFTP